MEIFTPVESEAKFVQKILSQLDFNANIYLRLENFVIYFKEGDSVCDFLGMIGADLAVERFEVARNIKEVRLQVTRQVNMETAALYKTIDAAQRQIADIKFLQARNIKLRKILADAMQVRLENPENTVAELAEKLSISRENLMYRFRLIRQYAKKIADRENRQLKKHCTD